MNNSNNDIVRLKNLLVKNKFGSDDRFEKLFYHDLCSVLSDYFFLSGEPLVKFEKTHNGYLVNASFNARELKPIKPIET